MDAAYRVTQDQAYWRVAHDHYQRQRPLILRSHIQALMFPAVFGLFALISWTFIQAEAALFVSLFGLVIVLSVIQGLLVPYLRFRRFVERYAGAEATYRLSKDGVTVKDALGQDLLLGWDVYPRACRFSDGIMLLGPNMMCWLPDALLEGVTPAEATALVRDRTVFRNVA